MQEPEEYRAEGRGAAGQWRPARRQDVPGLVALMTEFYRESGHALDRLRAGVAFEALVIDPSLGCIWVLEARGAMAGYMVLTLGFSMEYGGRDAFLDDLYLQPDLRGAGLGRAGLEMLLDACERLGVRAVHLEVGRQNAAARSLYGRFGFKDNQRLLLTRRLKSPL